VLCVAWKQRGDDIEHYIIVRPVEATLHSTQTPVLSVTTPYLTLAYKLVHLYMLLCTLLSLLPHASPVEYFKTVVVQYFLLVILSMKFAST